MRNNYDASRRNSVTHHTVMLCAYLVCTMTTILHNNYDASHRDSVSRHKRYARSPKKLGPYRVICYSYSRTCTHVNINNGASHLDNHIPTPYGSHITTHS